jgi:hypothetical protein
MSGHIIRGSGNVTDEVIEKRELIITDIRNRIVGLTTEQLECLHMVVRNISDFERFVWMLGQFAKSKTKETI